MPKPAQIEQGGRDARRRRGCFVSLSKFHSAGQHLVTPRQKRQFVAFALFAASFGKTEKFSFFATPRAMTLEKRQIVAFRTVFPLHSAKAKTFRFCAVPQPASIDRKERKDHKGQNKTAIVIPRRSRGISLLWRRGRSGFLLADSPE
jgi:hypothetical protein